MDKTVITRNFSKYASTYDEYADVQNRAAQELLGLISQGNIREILEIGSGTGNYTLLLKKRFSGAQIKAIDISDMMISVASEKINDEKIKFLLEDAETADLKGAFDLITSNACFHWFADLEKAVGKYKNLLKEGGSMLFSIFGPDTFRELSLALKDKFKYISTSSNGFMGKDRLMDIMDKNFKEMQIKEVIYEEYFPCLKDLLNKIKYSGVRGDVGGEKIFFTPGILAEIEEAYLSRVGQIKATYQVFFCRGHNTLN